MYCDSLDWLTDNKAKNGEWDFQGNAYLEAHLLYARALIEFITKTPQKRHPTDRFAVSFFDIGNKRFPKKSDILNKHSDIISKRLAHLTISTDPDGLIKSLQNYKIHEIAQYLIPYLQEFFWEVPDNRIDMNAKADALQFVSRYSSFQTSITVSPST